MSMPSDSPSPKYVRIACGMKASVTTTSAISCRRSRSRMCSMHGLPTIGHHRLRLVRGQRAEPRPLPARHDDRLHRRTSRRALATYCPAATTASARLIQNSTSGHQRVPLRDEHERRATRRGPRSRSSRAGRPRSRSRAGRRTCSPPTRSEVTEPGSRARSTEAGRRRRACTTQTSIISRSASGSATLPNADSTRQRRASQPSSWSVIAASPKTIPAGQLGPSARRTSSTTKTGIAANRRIVSTFGSWRSGAETELELHSLVG